MSAKPHKGLGRSFDSLIPSELLDESFDPLAAESANVSELRYIKLSEIEPDPEQPRRHFDETALSELAESIKEHGVLQPIVVVREAKSYVIVAGERRYRAAGLAGLDKIPALVRTLSRQHKLELSLIENLQRRDLNAIETAAAYEKLRNQFNLSLDEIGRRVGAAPSSVSNTIRLLKLPAPVKRALAEGKISEGQARPLVGLDEALAADVLTRLLRENWTARQVEALVVQLKEPAARAARKPSSPKLSKYEPIRRELEKGLGLPVTLKSKGKGGQLTVSFKNEQEFERLKKSLLT